MNQTRHHFGGLDIREPTSSRTPVIKRDLRKVLINTFS
jgi:hypothetical protein